MHPKRVNPQTIMYYTNAMILFYWQDNMDPKRVKLLTKYTNMDEFTPDQACATAEALLWHSM